MGFTKGHKGIGNVFKVGHKHSNETKIKIGLKSIGRTHKISEEGRLKLKLINTGKKMPPCSQETREKIRLT